MMTDAEVEAVARAICRDRGVSPDLMLVMCHAFDDGRPETAVSIPAWRNYVSAARTANLAYRAALAKAGLKILAREPTWEMVNAAWAAGDAAETWRDMWDVAPSSTDIADE